MKTIFNIVGLILLSLSLMQCQKEDIQIYDCTGIAPTYNNEVKAILDVRCASAGCHNAISKAESIDLSSYASAKNASARDNFLGAVQHKSGYDAMPKGSARLDDATIRKLTCWVQNGSLQ